MTCPRCRCADVHVVEVDRDGRLTVCCDDRNCGTRWQVDTHPSRLTKVRDLGAQLAGHRRAHESCPTDQPVARLMARGAIDATSRQILDLIADQRTATQAHEDETADRLHHAEWLAS